MELKEVVPWGRSLSEYKDMFSLSETDLGKEILGCGDGPASFNVELTELGNKVVSVDPIYQFDADQIHSRIDEVYLQVMDQVSENKEDYVLGFYRGGWCPYCNMELNALQKVLSEIEQAGAKLVAISPEVPDHSLATMEKNELTFDVLYDEGNRVAKTFGLVFELPEVLRPLYDELGIDIIGHNGDNSFQLPMPATYIISQQGEILYHFIDADYTKRSEPAEIIEKLREM